jgi:hypothetical protein
VHTRHRRGPERHLYVFTIDSAPRPVLVHRRERRCVRRSPQQLEAPTMKRLAIILILATTAVLADEENVMEPRRYVGPEQSDVQLLAVKETPPYGSDRPLEAKVTNNSKYYLDRVAIECNIFDDTGRRIFKDIVFKTSPTFTVKSGTLLPYFESQHMGIPPGATTEVGLYSDDTRWSRGFGKYKYDCHIYGVAGQD